MDKCKRITIDEALNSSWLDELRYPVVINNIANTPSTLPSSKQKISKNKGDTSTIYENEDLIGPHQKRVQVKQSIDNTTNKKARHCKYSLLT